MPSFVVYDTIFGALTIKQTASVGFEPNVTTKSERSAGSLAIDQISVLGAEPQLSLVTGDIDGVLTGLTSLNAGLFVTGGSIIMPFNQRSNGGMFEAGAKHFTLSGSTGLLIAQSFSASHGDEAGVAARLQAYMLSTDGETSPVQSNINQTLSASAFNFTHEFGPVSINGTQLTRAIAAEVIPGVSASYETYDGYNYPKDVFIDV